MKSEAHGKIKVNSKQLKVILEAQFKFIQECNHKVEKSHISVLISCNFFLLQHRLLNYDMCVCVCVYIYIYIYMQVDK